MDIRAELLREHSKPQATRIAKWIGNNAERFEQLMQLIMQDEYRVVQRAAWVLKFCAKEHAELLLPYLDRMLEHLRRPGVHDAVKRNYLKVFSEIDLPEAHLGNAADICFTFLADPKQAIAIHVFAMTVLYNICKVEPDLADELRILIEDGMQHGSPGYRSRGRKILKGLQKL